MIYQMARAVHYTHMRGLCHRDVKPDNFLIDHKGKLFLSDFGSAKRMRLNETSLCYVGNRAYRAPELHLGVKAYTQAVDIWAFGVLII
jgi:serine/threonine protein kinase